MTAISFGPISRARPNLRCTFSRSIAWLNSLESRPLLRRCAFSQLVQLVSIGSKLVPNFFAFSVV